jgi:hypothetical protein
MTDNFGVNNLGQGLKKDPGLTARSQGPRIRPRFEFDHATKDFVCMPWAFSWTKSTPCDDSLDS